VSHKYSVLAIMLGRLRMTVDDSIELCVAVSEKRAQEQGPYVASTDTAQERSDIEELDQTRKDTVVRQGSIQEALLEEPEDTNCRLSVQDAIQGNL